MKYFAILLVLALSACATPSPSGSPVVSESAAPVSVDPSASALPPPAIERFTQDLAVVTNTEINAHSEPEAPSEVLVNWPIGTVLMAFAPEQIDDDGERWIMARDLEGNIGWINVGPANEDPAKQGFESVDYYIEECIPFDTISGLLTKNAIHWWHCLQNNPMVLSGFIPVLTENLDELEALECPECRARPAWPVGDTSGYYLAPESATPWNGVGMRVRLSPQLGECDLLEPSDKCPFDAQVGDRTYVTASFMHEASAQCRGVPAIGQVNLSAELSEKLSQSECALQLVILSIDGFEPAPEIDPETGQEIPPTPEGPSTEDEPVSGPDE